MSHERSPVGQTNQLSFEQASGSGEWNTQPRSPETALTYGSRALLGVAMSLSPDRGRSFLQAVGAEFTGFPTSNSEPTPFYLGQELRQDTMSGAPSRYPTSTQTLTPAGWKYDGSKED
jgi:hypothetical protein